MSKVTIRTGGVVVGRRNSNFDLDSTTMILDLARRGYRVYVRGADQHQPHCVMVRDVDGVLHLEFSIHDKPLTAELLAGYGEPPWWHELHRHLELVAPSSFALRITNYSKDIPCPTP